MDREKSPFETISFHCRSPIYMCPSCSSAEKCKDLLQLLNFFRLEEKPPPFDYIANFPFTKGREDTRPDPKNSQNDLTASEWLHFTRSVASERYPNILGHELRRKHPEYKSPNLMGQIISFFTKPGDFILDPFSGTGSALIAASLMDREATGFEINIDWVDTYYTICRNENLQARKMVQGDCAQHLPRIASESADLVIIDPPNPITCDPPPMETVPGRSHLESYFTYMTGIFKLCYSALKPKKFMIVFTKNVYSDSKYVFITPHYSVSARNAGFILKGEKIQENPSEKTHPYGYPHSYVPNVVHHNILLFQKPAGNEKKK